MSHVLPIFVFLLNVFNKNLSNEKCNRKCNEKCNVFPYTVFYFIVNYQSALEITYRLNATILVNCSRLYALYVHILLIVIHYTHYIYIYS